MTSLGEIAGRAIAKDKELDKKEATKAKKKELAGKMEKGGKLIMEHTKFGRSPSLMREFKKERREKLRGK